MLALSNPDSFCFPISSQDFTYSLTTSQTVNDWRDYVMQLAGMSGAAEVLKTQWDYSIACCDKKLPT